MERIMTSKLKWRKPTIKCVEILQLTKTGSYDTSGGADEDDLTNPSVIPQYVPSPQG